VVRYLVDPAELHHFRGRQRRLEEPVANKSHRFGGGLGRRNTHTSPLDARSREVADQ